MAPNDKPEMLTIDELMQRFINSEVAKEALAHTEKRLTDLLETKKSFESRASSLLTGFITLALAVASGGAAFFTNTSLAALGYKYLPIAFILATIPLLYSAWCMVKVLQPSDYGALGSDPTMWLREGLIDAEINPLPWMQAILVFHMRQRIVRTEEANKEKADEIFIGTSIALASPIILVLAALPLINGLC